MIIESVLAGLLAGAFGALVGLGGGILLVPILTLVVGLPLPQAIPASLVGVVATAIGATAINLREGHAEWPLALRVAGIAMVAAIAGAQISRYVASSMLYILFALLLLAVTGRMMMETRVREPRKPRDSKWLAGVMFAGAGLTSGLLGVGGGILNVPAVHLALRRRMLTATATSSVIIAFTAAAGASSHAAAGGVIWPVAVACATGTFIGGRAGATLAPKLPRRALQWVFVVVLLYVAVEMAARGLGLKWWR